MDMTCRVCGAAMVPMIFSSFCPREGEHGGRPAAPGARVIDTEHVVHHVGYWTAPDSSVWRVDEVSFIPTGGRGWWADGFDLFVDGLEGFWWAYNDPDLPGWEVRSENGCATGTSLLWRFQRAG